MYLVRGVDCFFFPAERVLVAADGRLRCFEFDMPADKGAERVPLLIDMHGFMENGRFHRRHSGSRDVAASRGYAVAYPHGFRNSWNAGWCCGEAASARRPADDVDFLLGMRAQLLATQPRLDPRRVWLSGHSNGCMMAQRLALEAPSCFAAVACSSAYLEADASQPDLARYRRRPVAVMTAHALDDEVVPYVKRQGGARARGRLVEPDVRFGSALANIRRWAKRNGCEPGERTLWHNASGRHFRYAGCARGADVEHLALAAGAGHRVYYTAPQLARAFERFYSRFALPPCDDD